VLALFFPAVGQLLAQARSQLPAALDQKVKGALPCSGRQSMQD